MEHETKVQRSGTWDPIADSVKSLINSYLGKNYRNKRGRRTIGPFWRWLNAAFGAAILLIAVYVRATIALSTSGPSVGISDSLGKLSTGLELAWFLVAGAIGMLMGIVVAMSIREGGPLRLFIAGIFVSALPYALVFRTPVDGG